MTKPPSKPAARVDLWICVALVALIFAVYSQVRTYEFVQYDDPQYITQNAHVRAGLTAEGFAWAFTSAGVDNWFPLTWLSHMADVQFFGLDSGWHHLTNVFFHALATLLVFAALKRLTGARWPSAFVALVFAVHPLHVESVAWVAERKDVLSASFWFLTLWCYARYVEKPEAGRYALVLLAFAGGLMAKPMVVTLPFVLLLLDLWPLRRGLRIREKLPLVALAAALSVVTYLVQRHFGAVVALSGAPVSQRIQNALVSYVAYMVDMFWPAGLAVLYPYPHELPWWQWTAAGLLLAAISAAVVRQFRARPYLAVGWCWYLGTLVPVIGLVQVGLQARADRYMYIPMVGLTIMLAWGAAELLQRMPQVKSAVLAGAAIAGAACLAVTWFQIQYWATSDTLFQRAAQVTTGNYIMHTNLAEHYLNAGRLEEARAEASEALRINSAHLLAHVNLASALSRLGQPAAAESEYRKAIALDASNAQAHAGLGATLVLEHRPDEALAEMRLAVQLKPDYADGHYNLAMTLAAQGNLAEAANEFAAEARLRPNDPNVHYNLAIADARLGRLDDAIAQFTEALRLKPDFEAARRSLAVAQGQRDGAPKH